MTALFVTFATVLVASPALAAPVYEITARWADGTPTPVAKGDLITAEWRVNVNDDAGAPSNEPVENVTFTAVLGNGLFRSLPEVCLTADVEPVSSISADGRTLTCNLGTLAQGTAVAIQTPVVVDGLTGDQVIASGSINGQSTDLDPIDIVNVFAQDIHFGSNTGAIFWNAEVDAVEVDVQWSLRVGPGSDPGPDEVTYRLTVAESNGNDVQVGTKPNGPIGCTPFDSYSAPGHPWSGLPGYPEDQQAAVVDSCTLTEVSPGQFDLTLSGINYDLLLNPTKDSTGGALPTDWSYVASGTVWFHIVTSQAGSIAVSASTPTYESQTGLQFQDLENNNSTTKAYTLPGTWSASWQREYTNSGGTRWDDSYRVAAGTEVRQRVSNGFIADNVAPDSVYGNCLAFDTRYVTYVPDSTLSWALDRSAGTGRSFVPAALEYYVGANPLLDSSSPQYNPDQFDCGIADGGWTTTEPADPTEVKAVRHTFPHSQFAAEEANYLELYAQTTINADAPLGQDIWMFGSLGFNNQWGGTQSGGTITPTPDARYPYTNGRRDILRIAEATPAIRKSVDRAVVRPGEPANFTLTYSANGAGAIPATVDNFEIVDTLPLGMAYVAGSATPEPVVSTDGTGRQVLTWSLDGVPTNTLIPLSYQAVTDTSVEPGQVLTNTATATLGGLSAAAASQVTTSINGFTTIAKTTDQWFIANPDGSGDGEGSWTVTLRSQDPLVQDFTDTIDILPYNGDGRGTEYSGSYDVTSIDTPAGATVYYTTADPASLSDDPDEASNGSAGDIAGNTVGWSTTAVANPTAIRVIGETLAPGETFAFRVNIATNDAEPGDTWVNRAQAIAEHTELVMRTSEPLTMGTAYSASLKKYVQDADGEWRDANDVADYPSFHVGDTVRYRIVVENTGQGTIEDLEVSDDLQPELGSFIVESLAPGASETHEYEMVLETGSADTLVNTACAAAAQPEDSEDPVSINCDPAGIEVEGEPTHTKSIVSAEAIGGGQWEIVYSLEVTNASTSATSYSLADELHFTDQVDIVSAQVTGSPDGVALADPAWDGQENLNVALAVPLLGTDDEGYSSHTYLLTVVADVPLQFAPESTLPATQCAADGEDTDTAFNNTSELTPPSGVVEPDQACATPPSIDIAKTVSGGPNPNGDGTWTVTYDVVATNDGGAAGVYDISDRMTADGDLSVLSGQISSAPDGVTTSDSWTGLGAEGTEENVIATGVNLPAGEAHTYQVEVVIGLVEGTEGAPVITDCSADPGESGGLSNSAEIEHNDLTDDATACITVGVVTVDKSISAGPTPNGDGTWTVVYDIVATNVGAADADYDVTDRLHFGEGIEIVDHEVRSLDDIEVNEDWTGLGVADSDPENLIADDVTLAEGGTHTYEVEVIVQLDEATIDPTQLQCAAGDGEAGGLGNSTTLTSNGITSQDDVCPTLPFILLDKTVVDGSPVANGDGTWTIAYDVTATNTGATEGDYDLSDRLRYGAGIEVVSAAVVSSPDGVEPNAGWTGQGAEDTSENVIATGVTLSASATHTYRVEVIATLDQDTVSPADLACPTPGSNEAGGFANTAGLTHNGEDQDADACVTPPLIEITKSLAGAVVPVDGEQGVYDATYELTVTNSGPGAGVYDLDDQLAPGEGVTVVGIQNVTTDVTDGIALNDGFNGVDDLRIVTGQAIAGAESAPVVHTYTVTVRYAADLTGVEVPDGEVCTAPGGEALPGTLNNTATVGWNGLEDDDNACVIPGKPTLDKALVSAMPAGDGQWEVVYDLTVGNTGTEATTYDLDDEFLFAQTVTVDSVSVTGPEGVEISGEFDGDVNQRIATDVGIIGLDDDGYAPHVYRVTVIANVPLHFDSDAVGEDGTGSPACTVPAGSNLIEQGLNNAATLTDETGGTIVDTDCASLPSIAITKAMDGDPVKGSNDQWTVNYVITATNNGAASGDYTLTDELRYGAGIDVIDATISEAPTGVVPAATWTGQGESGAEENIVASDVALAAGGTHTYRVTVTAHLDTATANTSTLECPAAGSDGRGGFANTAGLNHNDLTDDASACAVPEWPEDVPPPLAVTGGELAVGVLGAGLLLLIAGGLLLYTRRRATAE